MVEQSRRSRHKASDYIHTFDELQPGDRVLLVGGVSFRDRVTNLDDVFANLRRRVKAKGGRVVGGHREVGPRYYSAWLIEVVAKAKRLRADWMLAESTDRWVRHHEFHTIQRPNLQATDDQLNDLVRLAGGTKPRPICTPMHRPRKVRRISENAATGQGEKGRRGGH